MTGGCSSSAEQQAVDGAALPTVDSVGPDPDAGGGDAAASIGARVVEVHDPKAVSSSNQLDAARVEAMLLAGLRDLTGESDLGQAWRAVLPDFSSKTRIGLKVNAINHRVGTSPQLVGALVKTLTKDLGASAAQLVVWDRTEGELTKAGLTSAALGVKVVSTWEGPGHEATQREVLGKKIRLSRILTEQTDVTINLPVLKDHDIAGITGGLKNIYGCFDDPGRFHDDMRRQLPALYRLDPFRRQTRLFVMEGLLACAHGGPVGPPTHRPARLLLAVDPVALDSRALALINGLRGAGNPVPASQLGWLAEAAKQGLGSASPQLVQRSL